MRQLHSALFDMDSVAEPPPANDNNNNSRSSSFDFQQPTSGVTHHREPNDNKDHDDDAFQGDAEDALFSCDDDDDRDDEQRAIISSAKQSVSPSSLSQRRRSAHDGTTDLLLGNERISSSSSSLHHRHGPLRVSLLLDEASSRSSSSDNDNDDVVDDDPQYHFKKQQLLQQEKIAKASPSKEQRGGEVPSQSKVRASVSSSQPHQCRVRMTFIDDDSDSTPEAVVVAALPTAATAAPPLSTSARTLPNASSPPNTHRHLPYEVCSRSRLWTKSPAEVHHVLHDHWAAQELISSQYHLVRPDQDLHSEVARWRHRCIVNVGRYIDIRQRSLQQQQPQSSSSTAETEEADAALWRDQEEFLYYFPRALVASEEEEEKERLVRAANRADEEPTTTTTSDVAALPPPAAAVERPPTTTARLRLKPHQVEGVRFLWRTLCDAPIDRIPAAGAILAHSMGLGKTCQVVCFLHFFLMQQQRVYQMKLRSLSSEEVHQKELLLPPSLPTQQPLPPKVLIVVPKSTLSGWASELKKWSAAFPEESRLHSHQPHPNNNNSSSSPSSGKSRGDSSASATGAAVDVFSVVVIDDRYASREARLEALSLWSTRGGVCVIGYESLVTAEKEIQRLRQIDNLRKEGLLEPQQQQQQSNGDFFTGGGMSKQKGPTTPPATAASLVLQRLELLFQEQFPLDLVVCDEGHRLKSASLEVAKALSRLHAVRRLILTGTPMQNHLLEYWAMADFALPKLFDRKSFLDYFVRPIEQAAHAHATPQVVAKARKQVFILTREFAHFCQRMDNAPLRAELPPIHEFVVTVPMSALQQQLYNKFLEIIRADRSASQFNLLLAFSISSKICAHPELLYSNRSAVSGSYASLLNIGSSAAATSNNNNNNNHNTTASSSVVHMNDGLKLKVAVDLVVSAKRNGEKCLVFSLSTKMLDLFETLLETVSGSGGEGGSSRGSTSLSMSRKRARDDDDAMGAALVPSRHHRVVVELVSSPENSTMTTTEVARAPPPPPPTPPTGVTRLPPAAAAGEESGRGRGGPIRFLRIDGSNSGTDRQRKLETFQGADSDIDVFLLTTRAGGVGITLTAATRVILLDCSFNPADDRQAMGRAYRYGQTKPVYVYRLVCRDTMEHRILDQKVSKEWMFHTVVDEKQLKRDALQGVKLRRLFVSAEDMRRPIGARAKEVTQQLIGQDPVGLGAVHRTILTAASHDSYLELDHEADQYGEEEIASYDQYRRRGGLPAQSFASEEELAKEARVREEARVQWVNRLEESATLTNIIDQIIADRSASSVRVRETLKRMGVVHEPRLVTVPPPTVRFPPPFPIAPSLYAAAAAEGEGKGLKRPLHHVMASMPVVQRRLVPVYLIDEEDEEDGERDPQRAPSNTNSFNNAVRLQEGEGMGMRGNRRNPTDGGGASAHSSSLGGPPQQQQQQRGGPPFFSSTVGQSKEEAMEID